MRIAHTQVHILRDANLCDIGVGTNEIRRMPIGRELFDGNA